MHICACMIYMYMYINVYIYVCIYIYICIYMCIYIYVYICICVYMYAYVYATTNTHTRMQYLIDTDVRVINATHVCLKTILQTEQGRQALIRCPHLKIYLVPFVRKAKVSSTMALKERERERRGKVGVMGAFDGELWLRGTKTHDEWIVSLTSALLQVHISMYVYIYIYIYI